MLICLSPAKSLCSDPVSGPTTTPKFQSEAERLAATGRNLSLTQLKSLMSISDDLAKLNRDRFQQFRDTPEGTQAAVFLFDGDTYKGLEARTLDPDALTWAQDHLRLLSGLYGVLRPLDAIRPYRLEMGSRLKTRRGASLYEFWGDTIANALTDDAKAIGSDILLNCASQEYFRAADRPGLPLTVITPRFYETKPSGPKMVSFFAKQARGAMARFVIERRISDPDGILDFDSGGYAYAPDLSSLNSPAFLR